MEGIKKRLPLREILNCASEAIASIDLMGDPDEFEIKEVTDLGIGTLLWLSILLGYRSRIRQQSQKTFTMSPHISSTYSVMLLTRLLNGVLP